MGMMVAELDKEEEEEEEEEDVKDVVLVPRKDYVEYGDREYKSDDEDESGQCYGFGWTTASGSH